MDTLCEPDLREAANVVHASLFWLIVQYRRGSESMDRRIFLRTSTAAVALAAGAGLLRPVRVLAEGFGAAFEATTAEAAIDAMVSGAVPSPSDKLSVRAPDIAENGGSVPVEIETDLDGIESLSIIVPKNPHPLIAVFEPGEGFAGFLNTRIKMRETSEVIALAKTSGGNFSSQVMVKVTVGGCGG